MNPNTAYWFGKTARKKGWKPEVDGKWAYEMQLSVSRAGELDKCPRKWFFKKVEKCKVPYTASTQFGTAIHQVNERYYLDEEMYPKDWWSVIDDYGNHAGDLGTEEQALLRQLVDKAIDEGLLFRHPGLKAEWKFEDEIVEGAYFEGSIDACYDFTIVDHKSVKSFDDNWNKISDKKSSRWLGKDSQMLIYGYYWAKYQELQGLEIPATIELIHNQFNKETGEVRQVTALVPFIKCISEYQKIQKSAMKMLNHNRLFNAGDWEKVETCDRRARYSPCNYCKYSDMCDGKETVDMYKRNIVENQAENQRNKELKDKSMSAGFKGFSNKSGATPEQEEALKEAQAEISGESPTPVETKLEIEPEVRTLEEVRAAISTFKEVCDENEMGYSGKKWDKLQAELAPLEKAEKAEIAKQAKAEAAKAKKEAEAAKKAEELAQKSADNLNKETEDAEKTTAAPKEEKAEEPEVKTKPPKAKTDKLTADKHFTKKDPIICINCQPLGTANKKIIQVLVKKYTDAIAEANNDCYYKLDTWLRRAQLRHDVITAYEAGLFDNLSIIVTGPSPDEQEAVNALLSAGIYGYVG